MLQYDYPLVNIAESPTLDIRAIAPDLIVIILRYRDANGFVGNIRLGSKIISKSPSIIEVLDNLGKSLIPFYVDCEENLNDLLAMIKEELEIE